MYLTLNRSHKKIKYTIGHLYVDGHYFCDTLEDRDRGLRSDMTLTAIKIVKVFGVTAIPTGTYTIDMRTVSPRLKDKSWSKPYGGVVPRLQGLKGFSGVLIHPGNTDDDTDGCILVGENKIKGKVINSAITYHRLMRVLLAADRIGEAITLTIK